MRLRPIDISKEKKRISLRGVKLPVPEVTQPDPGEVTLSAPPETKGKGDLFNLIARNPSIGLLMEAFDLVEVDTGNGVGTPQRPDRGLSLSNIARDILETENNYSQEEIIARIIDKTNITRERAERGFNLMLEQRVIELTNGERYCLTGSTPF